MTETRHSWIEEVRLRLENPPAKRLPPPDHVRQAAVLVPLFVDAGELWTLLTVRSQDLPHHRSQIAFPGGSREPGEDHWAAALREAQEEVELDPAKALKLGTLDERQTGTGFRIIPCVAAVPNDFAPVPDKSEIDEVFRVPLSAFANPALIEDRRVLVNDRERTLRIYHVGKRQVWGLTAGVLHDLLLRLGLQPRDAVEG
jgi:8-oxo-dGTP pyrophosphatase MutT (NUDIX family)